MSEIQLENVLEINLIVTFDFCYCKRNPQSFPSQGNLVKTTWPSVKSRMEKLIIYLFLCRMLYKWNCFIPTSRGPSFHIYDLHHLLHAYFWKIFIPFLVIFKSGKIEESCHKNMLINLWQFVSFYSILLWSDLFQFGLNWNSNKLGDIKFIRRLWCH